MTDDLTGSPQWQALQDALKNFLTTFFDGYDTMVQYGQAVETLRRTNGITAEELDGIREGVLALAEPEAIGYCEDAAAVWGEDKVIP